MSTSNHHAITDVLAPVVRALQESLGDDLVAVALFGSRARGEAGPESDWDLLLIAHHLPEKPFRRHLHLKALLPEAWRARVSPLAKTPAEFEARLPSVYLDITLDGRLLYDPRGYLQERLTLLRGLMERLGLQRVRENGDLVWRWRGTPPREWSLQWEVVP